MDKKATLVTHLSVKSKQLQTYCWCKIKSKTPSHSISMAQKNQLCVCLGVVLHRPVHACVVETKTKSVLCLFVSLFVAW